jgi:hypothetical protein
VLSLCYTLLDEIGHFLEKIKLQLFFWTELLVIWRLLAARVLAPHSSCISREVREIIGPMLLLVAKDLVRHIS